MDACQKKRPSLNDANDIPSQGSDRGLTGSVMPDSNLLALACQGDQSAFEDLFERYRMPLLRWIWRFVKNHEQAEDILQQVFLQFYLSLPSLVADSTVKDWLYRVAAYRSIDLLRRRKRVSSLCSFTKTEEAEEAEEATLLTCVVLCAPVPKPEEYALFHETQEELRAAVARLPLILQRIVALRVDRELSYAEISEQLHIPVPTARSYFHRAKQQLTRCLTREEEHIL